MNQIAGKNGVNDEQVIGYGYDALGNRTAVSVNGMVITRTTYDKGGRTVETVQASGHKQVRKLRGPATGLQGYRTMEKMVKIVVNIRG